MTCKLVVRKLPCPLLKDYIILLYEILFHNSNYSEGLWRIQTYWGIEYEELIDLKFPKSYDWEFFERDFDNSFGKTILLYSPIKCFKFFFPRDLEISLLLVKLKGWQINLFNLNSMRRLSSAEWSSRLTRIMLWRSSESVPTMISTIQIYSLFLIQLLMM